MTEGHRAGCSYRPAFLGTLYERVSEKMALRAVPDHPKFADLKARLGKSRYATLGVLESVWHFAGRFTPQGNIGKYDDAAIEAWIEWDGNPGECIAALIGAKWLDPDAIHRILVHDWAKHADKATKNSNARNNLEFYTYDVRTVVPKSGTPYPLPEPVPEPVPVPVRTYAEIKASFEADKLEDVSMLTPKTDDSWLMLIHASDSIPLVRPEGGQPEWDLWRWKWCPLSFEQRKKAVDRLCVDRYPDAAYAPTLEKYICGKYLDTVRPRSNGAKPAIVKVPPPIIPPDNRPLSEKFER